MIQLLLQNGYAWTTAPPTVDDELRAFFSLCFPRPTAEASQPAPGNHPLYGSHTDLERLDCGLPPEKRPDVHASLGNPLVGVLLQHIMGEKKHQLGLAWLSMQRVWARHQSEAESEVVVLRGTHAGMQNWNALKTGRHTIPPLNWSSAPHITRGLHTGRRIAMQSGVVLKGKGLLLVTESVLLSAMTDETRWCTWSPVDWSRNITGPTEPMTLVEESATPVTDEAAILHSLRHHMDPLMLDMYDRHGLVRRDLLQKYPEIRHLAIDVPGDETLEWYYVSLTGNTRAHRTHTPRRKMVTITCNTRVPSSARGLVSHILRSLLLNLHRLPTENKDWAKRPHLPYGAAVIGENSNDGLAVALPRPFAACQVVFSAHWSADDPVHVLTLKDRSTGLVTTCMQFGCAKDLINAPVPLSHSSVLQNQTAAHVVEVAISRGAVPPSTHGSLCALLILVNPLPLLEEVVALVTQITTMVLNDNRTLTDGDLEMCAELQHRRRGELWCCTDAVHASCPNLSRLQLLPMTEKIRVSLAKSQKASRHATPTAKPNKTSKKVVITLPHRQHQITRDPRLTFRGSITRLNAFQRRISYSPQLLTECEDFDF